MAELIRVLIVDDEVALRNTLKLNLPSDKYKVYEASTGQEGIEICKDVHPHIVLLDLGLPDMTGLDVVKDLRRWTRVPVIVLTVTDDEQMKVKLLDAGADDYLTKPFGVHELQARLRVAIRNIGMIEATPTFVSGELEIDVSARRVCVGSKEIKVTATEFELLALLVRDRGRVVPQSQLMRKIWGAIAEDQTHYLRIYINQLRKKIEPNPGQPQHILTEPGVGYRLV